MDPNESLRRLRELFGVIAEQEGDTSPYVVAETEEVFSALDEWLSRGGFLPSDWSTVDRPNHGPF